MSNLKYHMINGAFIPVDEAKIHITDLSILRGFAIFDYFRVRRGKAVFMEDHLERFFRSARLIGLNIPYEQSEVQGMIEGLIKKNGLEKFSIRLQLTGGYSDNGFEPATPNLFLLSLPFPNLPEKFFKEGWHVMTYKYQRELPEVKTTNYLTGIQILPLLEENDADAVLYHDGTHIRESDRSNFFIVNQEGVLVTPKDKILLGVSRKITLKVAQGVLKTEERDITLEELRSAKEMFLTSSTKPILPVTILDGKEVGNGKPGPVTTQLMELFQRYLEDYLGKA
ncbi:MAG: aminotransferase IV [Bacteroidetes bacterium]|nr:MAG: aminotransferase IV [Bacteroidota bacterium]